MFQVTNALKLNYLSVIWNVCLECTHMRARAKCLSREHAVRHSQPKLYLWLCYHTGQVISILQWDLLYINCIIHAPSQSVSQQPVCCRGYRQPPHESTGSHLPLTAALDLEVLQKVTINCGTILQDAVYMYVSVHNLPVSHDPIYILPTMSSGILSLVYWINSLGLL